jgi:radical SAM-linked protein
MLLERERAWGPSRSLFPILMGLDRAMVPASTAVDSLPAAPDVPHVCDKIRIRFRKGAGLRFLSHHDLMRTMERMLRRAALPFRRTQGFHPKARLVFALSLPLGVIGCEEVVEIELDQVLPLEELEQRLRRQAPPGLELLSLRRIEPKMGAQVRRLTYRLPVPAERTASLAQRIADVLAAEECWVQRERPSPRRVNIRPFLAELRFSALLEMTLWLTPVGTARPDEVLGLLGLEDLPAAGCVLERSRLELHDEVMP